MQISNKMNRASNGRYVSTPAYRQWDAMRTRCNKDSKHRLLYPTYEGVSCSEDFNDFELWLEWAKQQIGFGNTANNGKVWPLDKDILLKGNKLYSPDYCVFIPNEINNFVTNRKTDRGEYPIGVHYSTKEKKYIASCSMNSKKYYIGGYHSVEESFMAYKQFKEQAAKQLATQYNNLVDIRVINALNSFTVDIDD